MHSNTRQAVRVDALGLREMVLGKSRQAHQRTIMHSNTRQAANNHALEHSTGSERVDAFGLREMVLGKSRQAHQRTAGSPANGRLTSERKAYLPLPIVTHQSLDPAARALKRQASCLLRGLTSEQSCTRTLDRQRTIMHSNTRQALNESTRSVYAKWYWVNHGRLTSERQAHQRTQTRQARALKRQASCLCTRTLEHELKRQASCLCTRTLEHEMVLGKSRQDNHALEHKSRQAHQRTIMHSNTRTRNGTG